MNGNTPHASPTLRLIIDPTPRDGAINLAMDMSLLEAANPSSYAIYSADRTDEERLVTNHVSPILRFYRWIPTLSLGHFQSADAIPRTFFHTKTSDVNELSLKNATIRAVREMEKTGAEETLELVKRPSGGGAILHQYEWTYALILPPGYELTPSESRPMATQTERLPLADSQTVESSSEKSPVEPIRQLHRVTAAMLRRQYHLNALLYEDFEALPPRHKERTSKNKTCVNTNEPFTHQTPFLCFERRAPEDVVVPVPQAKREPSERTKPSERAGLSYKILGSAMRLRRGARLLHGSFLLRHSPWTPHLLGVADLISERVSDVEREAWEMRFLEAWQTSILSAFFARWTLDCTPLSDAEWTAAHALAQRFTL